MDKVGSENMTLTEQRDRISQLFLKLHAGAVWIHGHPNKIEDIDGLIVRSTSMIDELETLGVPRGFGWALLIFDVQMTKKLINQFMEDK